MQKNKIECCIITVKKGYKPEENRYLELLSQINSNPADEYFNVSFFDGITAETAELKNLEIIEGIHPSNLYNWLSHYSLWNQKSDMLILEDDVLIDGIDWQKIYSTINHFKKCKLNSILYLQSSQPEGQDKEYTHIQKETDFLSRVTPHQHEGHHYAGTAAYFITADVASYLADNVSMIRPTDSYLHNRVLLEEIGHHTVPIDYLNYFKINSKLWSNRPI